MKSGDKIRILIADDAEIARNGYEMLLAKSGNIEICGMASTGDETIEMYHRLKPDVVLLDIIMPGKDGIKTCKELVYKDEHAKVILNTAILKDEVIKNVLSSGAKSLLLKEADHHELEKAITIVNGGGEYYNKLALDMVIKRLLNTNAESMRSYWSNQFSEREISIIQLTSLGHTSAEIGKKLNLSKRSIEVSRGAILKTMKAKNVVEMIIRAYKTGLLDMDMHKTK